MISAHPCFIIFSDWLRDHEMALEFETLGAEDLCELLRRFYGDVRSKVGVQYGKSSLINIRAGLNRHLTSPPYNRQENIMRDRCFQRCNQVLTGILRTYRERGMDKSIHKDALSPADIRLAYSTGTLSTKNAVSLQRKVYFEVSLHCARRGCQGLRELRKDSFVIKSDSEGREYATLAYHELEKNHQGLDKRERDRDPRMYGQPGDDNCPIKSLRLYLSKLNGSCDAFFQRANLNSKYTDATWYCNIAIGRNTLSEFMKVISKESGMSKIYTNHCLRATSATALHSQEVNPLDIIAVTGHKNTDSLKPYINRCTDEQRYKMSSILHDHGKEKGSTSSSESALVPESGDSAASTSSSSSESALVPVRGDNVASTSSSESALVPQRGDNHAYVSANHEVVSMSSMQVSAPTDISRSLFAGATFAGNCNPVFNFYGNVTFNN